MTGRPSTGQTDAEILKQLDALEQTAREAGVSTEAVTSIRRALEDRRLAEQALRQQQAHEGRHTDKAPGIGEVYFQSFLEAAPDPMVIVDEQGQIVLVNAHAEKMFGYRREELVGQKIEILVPERFHAAHVKDRGHYTADPTVRPMGMRRELQGRRKDGSEIYIEVSLSPIRTDQGLFIASAIRDVTERKHAQDALRQSEERFRLLVDGVKDYAMFLIDPEGRVISWNSGAQRIKGYTSEQAIGHNIDVCYTAEDRAQGSPKRELEIAAREDRYERERWIVRSDGSRFWAHVVVTALRNDDGTLRGFAEVAHDITERKRVEDELARANANIRIVLESITDSLFALDHNWRYTYVNDRAAEIHGRSREELLGKTLWDIFPELVGTKSFHQYQKAMTEKVPTHCESLVPSLGRWIESYIYPTKDGVLAYSRDVTERKVVEEQQRRHEEALKEAKEQAESANHAKDQFLAMLSHELRTPLAPVLATISLMEDSTDLPSELKEEIHVIHRNVEMEARLIDDLLDLTRISRGKIELHREVLDIHAALRQTLEICQAEIQAKRLEVSLSLWANRHMVWADPGRIQQVFWNLVKNAVKFTPVGGRISLRTSDVEQKAIRIEISDTGVGIEKELLPRLFTAFEQGGQGTTRQFGGLGLGLAISKSIIDLHGGMISATSEGKGKGSTFVVELIAAAAGTANRAAPAAPPKQQQEHKRTTILFVEDNEDTRRIMVRLLRNTGYEVFTAGSVQEALDALGHQPIDVLVSDLGLPDGTGYDIMRQVKGQKDIKGIALSGYGMEEDIARSMESGFSRHLVKPVKPNELNAAISELAASP